MPTLSSDNFFKLLLTCNNINATTASIKLSNPKTKVLSESSAGAPAVAAAPPAGAAPAAGTELMYAKIASISLSVKLGNKFIAVLLYSSYNFVA